MVLHVGNRLLGITAVLILDKIGFGTEVTVTIQHIIQTEVNPIFLRTIHLHRAAVIIHARNEPYQTGNHRIIKK